MLITTAATPLPWGGIDFEMTDDALKEVAKLALEKKIGARALRATMEEVLKDIMYLAPDIKHLKAIKMTKEAVKNSSEAMFFVSKGESDLRKKSLKEARA